jgi:peptidoglycan DL-endopeptidase CwlO
VTGRHRAPSRAPFITTVLAAGLVSLLLAGLSFALTGSRSHVVGPPTSGQAAMILTQPVDTPSAAPETDRTPEVATTTRAPSTRASTPARPRETTAAPRSITPRTTTRPVPTTRPAPAKPPATRSAPAQRPSAAPKPAAAPAPPAVPPRPAAANTGGIVAYAEQLAHRTPRIPYVFGGKTEKGFDCSGFVWYVLNHTGHPQPYRMSGALKSWATPIRAADARPGDLVFYPGHVAIFVGNNAVVDAGNSALGVTERPMWPGATFGRIPN